jgi:hypothetical protein
MQRTDRTSPLPRPCSAYLLGISSGRAGIMRHLIRNPSSWRVLGCFSVVVMGWSFASARSSPEAKVEMTVQLPPFIVEQPAGPKWLYLHTPRYEILSRCDVFTTERLALAFHRANQLLDLVVPPRFQIALDVPQTLILYDEKLWPVAEQRAVAALLQNHPPARPADLPASGTPPRIRLEPVSGAGMIGLAAKQESAPGSFFSNLMLSDADSITTFALVSEATIDPHETYLTPAYVRNLLESRAPALPEWFTAGFMRLYTRMDFHANTVAIRDIRWGFDPKDTSNPDATLIPWVHFFAENTPRGANSSSWLSQAELFVCWGIDPAFDRSPAFWRFVDRLSTESVNEGLFQECFGLTFAEATRQIGAYALDHRALRWVLPEASARLPDQPVQDATSLQIARIKGEWERLEARYVKRIQPDLESHYVALARRTLHRAYDREDHDPRLLASLGLLELDAGDKSAARPLLEDAVQRAVVRPRAYYELAKMRHVTFFGRSTRNDGRLLPKQTAAVLEPLLLATHQSPPLLAVYELMAHVCSNSVEPPSPEVLAALAQGARLFPDNDDLLKQAAELHAKAGASAEAKALLRLGLDHRPPMRQSSREQLHELSKKLLNSSPSPAPEQSP